MCLHVEWSSIGAITAAFLCIRRDEIESVLRVSRRLGTEVFSNSEITQKMAGISNLLFRPHLGSYLTDPSIQATLGLLFNRPLHSGHTGALI